MLDNYLHLSNSLHVSNSVYKQINIAQYWNGSPLNWSNKASDRQLRNRVIARGGTLCFEGHLIVVCKQPLRISYFAILDGEHKMEVSILILLPLAEVAPKGRQKGSLHAVVMHPAKHSASHTLSTPQSTRMLNLRSNVTDAHDCIRQLS